MKQETAVMKYKNIVIRKFGSKIGPIQKLIHNLSVIGEHVHSVELIDTNNMILDLIKNKCKNLNSIQLWDCSSLVKLPYFVNLKEIKLVGNKLSTRKIKKLLEYNNGLECLECWYDKDYQELLESLPYLRSLWFYDVPSRDRLNFAKNQLTKFSFESRRNCNDILVSVAKTSDLVELHIYMDYDDEIFGV